MTPKIAQKMLAVQSELKRLAKEGDFDGGMVQYKFLAVDDVVKAVRPLLNKHGVIVLPTVVNERIEMPLGEPLSGRPPKGRVHLFLTVEYQFVAAEDGSSVTVRVVGEAADVGDKSVRKAMTSAQKIAFIQAFTIETGEPDEHELGNPGADQDTPEPAAVRSAKDKRKQATVPSTKQPAEKTGGSKRGMTGLRGEVKTQVIDAGLATGAEVNEVLKAFNAENGLDKSTDASYQAVLDKFVGGN